MLNKTLKCVLGKGEKPTSYCCETHSFRYSELAWNEKFKDLLAFSSTSSCCLSEYKESRLVLFLVDVCE